MRPIILGCSGPALTASERTFFHDADPAGFILFARNCETPDQTRALIRELRAAVGRADAPVLIDQEGGRVQRLSPPHWPARPPAARFARLYESDPDAGLEAARLNARLIAADLVDLGITVDCAPVLDISQSGADPIIGDRAYGHDPAQVAALGRAVAEGLLAGGVLPVIKHIPGHGRATVDSHKALPVVEASLDDLTTVDFAPFAALRDMPWAMTAHVVYRVLDGDHPATTSERVIAGVIRGSIGFDGVLVSDDLSMQALSGGMRERCEAALAAGCDLALHCNGQMAEMEAAVAGCPDAMDDGARRRMERAEAMRVPPENLDGTVDTDEAVSRLHELLEKQP